MPGMVKDKLPGASLTLLGVSGREAVLMEMPRQEIVVLRCQSIGEHDDCPFANDRNSS